jgi:hypothetical protein
MKRSDSKQDQQKNQSLQNQKAQGDESNNKINLWRMKSSRWQ